LSAYGVTTLRRHPRRSSTSSSSAERATTVPVEGSITSCLAPRESGTYIRSLNFEAIVRHRFAVTSSFDESIACAPR